MTDEVEQFDDDAFDIAPEFSGGMPPVGGVEEVPAPAFVLTADRVRAVRFHPAKPGYQYAQVETFVDQVADTLRYLEARLYQAERVDHERQEDILDLQERVTTLTATIEVFRASGDPVAAADGSYLTESSAQAQSEQLVEARVELEQLRAEVAAAREDAERGWAAEAELRRYLDETLAPWLAAQVQAEAPTPDVAEVAVLPEEPSEGQDVAPDTVSEAGDGAEASPLPAVATVDVEPAVNPAPLVEEVVLDVEQADEEIPQAESVVTLSEEPVEQTLDEVALVEVAVAVDTPAIPQVESTSVMPTPSPEDEARLAVALAQAIVAGDVEVIERPAEPAPMPVTEAEPLPSPAAAPFAVSDDDWAWQDTDDASGSEQGQAAPAMEEAVTAPTEELEAARTADDARRAILASSPELAALGVDLPVDLPPVEGASVDSLAAPAAGAPLPRLLANAPELAAHDSADLD